MTVLIRFHDLQKRKIVNNWVTLAQWIEHEGFPPGIKLGPNTRAWDETSIDIWLASRPLANSETEAA